MPSQEPGCTAPWRREDLIRREALLISEAARPPPAASQRPGSRRWPLLLATLLLLAAVHQRDQGSASWSRRLQVLGAPRRRLQGIAGKAELEAEEKAFDEVLYTIECEENASGHHGEYLNVVDAGQQDGVRVQLWDNPLSPETQWHIRTVSPGIFAIESGHAPGKYLHTDDPGRRGGTAVQIWGDPLSPKAQWRLHPVAAGVYTVESVQASGQYMQVLGDNVQLSNGTSSLDTRWRLAKARKDDDDEVEEGERQARDSALPATAVAEAKATIQRLTGELEEAAAGKNTEDKKLEEKQAAIQSLTAELEEAAGGKDAQDVQLKEKQETGQDIDREDDNGEKFWQDQLQEEEAEAPYTVVHDGHCAAGWLGLDIPNTQQPSIDGCSAMCLNEPTCGYFSYSSGSKNCALYTAEGGCADDNVYPGYKSYRIIRQASTYTIKIGASGTTPRPVPTASPTPVTTAAPTQATTTTSAQAPMKNNIEESNGGRVTHILFVFAVLAFCLGCHLVYEHSGAGSEAADAVIVNGLVYEHSGDEEGSEAADAVIVNGED